jgi:hypothetical protein
MVKNTVFPGCSSLSMQSHSTLADVQKIITLRPVVISSSVNTVGKLRNFYTSLMFKTKSDFGR